MSKKQEKIPEIVQQLSHFFEEDGNEVHVIGPKSEERPIGEVRLNTTDMSIVAISIMEVSDTLARSVEKHVAKNGLGFRTVQSAFDNILEISIQERKKGNKTVKCSVLSMTMPKRHNEIDEINEFAHMVCAAHNAILHWAEMPIIMEGINKDMQKFSVDAHNPEPECPTHE